MNLYIGKIIENDATKAGADEAFVGNTGAVQIYIEALMHDFKTDQYHWFRPAQGGIGGSATFGTSCIPEKNSYVWCFYEDELLYRKGFYIWNVNLTNLNPHQLFEQNIKADVGAESIYPDVKYIYLPNKICLAISSSASTPELTIYHPKAYIFIDKNGYTYFKDSSGNRLKFDKDGFRLKDTKNNEIRNEGTKIIVNTNFTVEQ